MASFKKLGDAHNGVARTEHVAVCVIGLVMGHPTTLPQLFLVFHSQRRIPIDELAAVSQAKSTGYIDKVPNIN